MIPIIKPFACIETVSSSAPGVPFRPLRAQLLDDAFHLVGIPCQPVSARCNELVATLVGPQRCRKLSLIPRVTKSVRRSETLVYNGSRYPEHELLMISFEMYNLPHSNGS